MSIGHREFQIPKHLFTDPGNSPNFFSLGFAVFFSSPEDLFPGLDREGLIRPPSILPPSVPNRSADTFAEILHLLRGYPVSIRSEVHRQCLLSDCRYFNFKGLEQKLIPHHISFNQVRQREEIIVQLEDILKSGVTIQPEPTPQDPNAGWVNYARPYVDDKCYELLLEIGGENTKLYFSFPSSSNTSSQTQKPQPHNPQPKQQQNPRTSPQPPPYSSPPPQANLYSASASSYSATVKARPLATARAEFFRDGKIRVSKLFEVIATKLSLPPRTQPLGLLMASGGAGSQPASPGNTPISEDLVRVTIEPDTSITLDGQPFPATQMFAAFAPATVVQGGVAARGGAGVVTGEEDSPAIGDSQGRPNAGQVQQEEAIQSEQQQRKSKDSPSTVAAAAIAGSNHHQPPDLGVHRQKVAAQQQQQHSFLIPPASSSILAPSTTSAPVSSSSAATTYAPGDSGSSVGPVHANSRKRRRIDIPAGWNSDAWIVKTGQWRLRIQSSPRGAGVTSGGGSKTAIATGVECVLVAVKLDAFTGERGRNANRNFLNG